VVVVISVKTPEKLVHLFVNCKLVDSVWTENFQKINEFYEQNEIKTNPYIKIRKYDNLRNKPETTKLTQFS
jgi:hypothetical protein